MTERDEVKVEQKDIILIEEKQTEGNKKRSGEELKKEDSSQASCSKSPLLPCMDKLREELSCAVSVLKLFTLFMIQLELVRNELDCGFMYLVDLFGDML